MTKPEWSASSTFSWSLLKLVFAIGKKCFDNILLSNSNWPFMILIWFGYVLVLVDTGFEMSTVPDAESGDPCNPVGSKCLFCLRFIDGFIWVQGSDLSLVPIFSSYFS